MTEKMGSSQRVPRARGDLDQAIRYLKSADEILQRAGASTLGLRRALEPVIRRLGGDPPATDTARFLSEMRVLSKQLREVNQADAATEILKAVAVLRDKSP